MDIAWREDRNGVSCSRNHFGMYPLCGLIQVQSENRDEMSTLDDGDVIFYDAEEHFVGSAEDLVHENKAKDVQVEKCTPVSVADRGTWLAITDLEMNRPWPSHCEHQSCHGIPYKVLEARLYRYVNSAQRATCGSAKLLSLLSHSLCEVRSYLVLRCHTAACDRVSAAILSRELLRLLDNGLGVGEVEEGEGDGRSDGRSLEKGQALPTDCADRLACVEDCIPPRRRRKPFWSHGIDLIGQFHHAPPNHIHPFLHNPGSCHYICRLWIGFPQTCLAAFS